MSAYAFPSTIHVELFFASTFFKILACGDVRPFICYLAYSAIRNDCTGNCNGNVGHGLCTEVICDRSRKGVRTACTQCYSGIIICKTS